MSHLIPNTTARAAWLVRVFRRHTGHMPSGRIVVYNIQNSRKLAPLDLIQVLNGATLSEALLTTDDWCGTRTRTELVVQDVAVPQIAVFTRLTARSDLLNIGLAARHAQPHYSDISRMQVWVQAH
jgi:hypothetical protein